MCRFGLQNGALWDICVTHCGICEKGPLHYIMINSPQNTVNSWYVVFFVSSKSDKRSNFADLVLYAYTGPSYNTGFEISNWMHLSVGQVDCKNHLSECTIHFHLSEIYKANATYVKIRNMQSSIGQILQVFHLSDCHFYSSQTIGRVKFLTLNSTCLYETQTPSSYTSTNCW